jgi:hypothetical protein
LYYYGENYHKQTLEKTKKSNQERTIQRYWAQEMERGQTKYQKQTSKQTNFYKNKNKNKKQTTNKAKNKAKIAREA